MYGEGKKSKELKTPATLQITRLKRICDVPEQYDKSKVEMLSKFRERNHQEDWLVCAENKVDSRAERLICRLQI